MTHISGTEANLLATWVARNMVNISNPEVIVSESAHFSFRKISNLLKLKLVQASLDRSYRVEPSSVESHINKNTIAIIGSAGTTELGVIDPIDKLSEIALNYGVYLHVNAAFGGLVLPFLKELGYNVPDFDFQLQGVRSITVDPHKMGMSTIPAGGILFRDSAYLEYIKTETPYLTEQFQYTIVGTRTGASVAATWAMFEYLGREGYKNIVRRCMKLTGVLASGLESLGFKLVTQPMLNMVVFRSLQSNLLTARLQQYGWIVSYVPRLNCIRMVVMPHLKEQHVTAFLETLRKIMQKGELHAFSW